MAGTTFTYSRLHNLFNVSISINLKMLGNWISQISWAHLQYCLNRRQQARRSSHQLGRDNNPYTYDQSSINHSLFQESGLCSYQLPYRIRPSDRLITFPTQSCYLSQLLHRACSKLLFRAVVWLGFFLGFYYGFGFFSSKKSLLLPSCFQGKRDTSAPSTAEGTYKDTTKTRLFMKLPPVRETSHFFTYPELKKAWFMSKIAACKIIAFVHGARHPDFNGMTFLEV